MRRITDILSQAFLIVVLVTGILYTPIFFGMLLFKLFQTF